MPFQGMHAKDLWMVIPGFFLMVLSWPFRALINHEAVYPEQAYPVLFHTETTYFNLFIQWFARPDIPYELKVSPLGITLMILVSGGLSILVWFVLRRPHHFAVKAIPIAAFFTALSLCWLVILSSFLEVSFPSLYLAVFSIPLLAVWYGLSILIMLGLRKLIPQ